MSLRDQMTADAAIFTSQNDFGELVDWYVGGEKLAAPVLVQLQFGGMAVKKLGDESVGSAQLLVPMAALDGIPDGGDWFVRSNGEVWSFNHHSLIGNDQVFYHLSVSRDKRQRFVVNHD